LIPSQIVFPYHKGDIKDPKLAAYIKELLLQLQLSYETIATNVNGQITSDKTSDRIAWTPTIRTSNDNEGTVTYDHQTGWVLRQGVMVDVWFDVEWTGVSGTPTGNLILDLPYAAAISADKPFVGVCQGDNITYTNSYLVCNATPNTRELTFWGCGSAAAEAQVAFDSAGQVIGHVRYIGQGQERV